MTAQIRPGRHPMDAADAQRRDRDEGASASDVSPRSLHDVLGVRIMTRLGLAGLLVLLLGMGLPRFLASWGSFTTGPGVGPASASEGTGSIGSAVLVVGVGLLMLAALAGMIFGPFSHLQQKYGTGVALLAFVPPMLSFAAILTMAFQ